MNKIAEITETTEITEVSEKTDITSDISLILVIPVHWCMMIFKVQSLPVVYLSQDVSISMDIWLFW